MGKIKLAISYGIRDESIDWIKDIRAPIQLGVFHSSVFNDFRLAASEELRKNKIEVVVVHLPIDCARLTPYEIFEIMDYYKDQHGVMKFVIHPNQGIEKFVNDFAIRTPIYELCIENFQWRRKKPLRTPLNIHDMCRLADNIKMAFDTSHAEDIWFDKKIFSYFIDKVSIIHLSNRTGKIKHKPFNCMDGDINLVAFVRDLRREYDWSGVLVLEYSKDYRHKLYENIAYLEKILGIEKE